MNKAIVVVMAALLWARFVGADDWPQWNGPNRDNLSKETGLLKEWPREGPRLLWTFNNAGQGYAGPAIAGEVLYCMGARGDTEYVYALDLKVRSGQEVKQLWAVKIGPKFTWKGNQWNAGSLATPTVQDGLVLAHGGQGELVCVDAAQGAVLWRKSLTKDLAGEVNPVGGGPEKIGWGFATSPLVDGGQVVCVPGGPQGTLAALDRKTGKLLWRSKDFIDQATYASPIAADMGGVRQYLQMTNEGVAGVAARNGALLWYYKHEKPYTDIVAVTPIVRGNLVFISVGGGAGCDLIRLTVAGGKFQAEKVYANKNLSVLHGGMVLVGEHVFGATGEARRSKWVCLGFQSGEPKWATEDPKLGRGSLTFADGCLYCFGEYKGLVVLAEASTKKWTVKGQFSLPQVSRLRLPRGGYWTHPVVANGRLYLRDQELLFCYDVRGKRTKVERH